MRLLHYSKRTEQAYVDWIRRFILFHNKRHPREMGGPEIEAFLTHLAIENHVAASTQNQEFSALLFCYQKILEIQLPQLNALRAQRPEHLPVVLAVEEIRVILAELDGTDLLMAETRYFNRQKGQVPDISFLVGPLSGFTCPSPRGSLLESKARAALEAIRKALNPSHLYT